MANQYVNKVEYGNDTLIDLTSDTVTAADLSNGVTAHDRSGAPIVGTGMGGHTIQNASGTDMTARAGLQFKSGKVSDDSVNDRTVVEQVVPLTEAEYQALPSSKNSDNTFYYARDGVTQPLPSLGYTPVGTIISVMGTSAPTNFLACNGQTVNIADYPVLANYFLEQFGQVNKFGGDGTTTFGIPDLRGEFLRGTGTNSHADGGNGAAVGSHQGATELPNIFLYSDGTTYTIASRFDSDGFYPQNTDKWGAASTKYANVNISSMGDYSDREAFYVRPTNTSVLYCIAVRDIYIGKDSALAGRVDAINERFNYSTAEKVVGKWIDGKPIYRKTANTGAISATGTYTIPFANMETVVDQHLLMKKAGGGFYFPTAVHAGQPSNYTAAPFSIDGIGTDNNATMFITLGTNITGDNYAVADSWLTLWYTKTTDTAS